MYPSKEHLGRYRILITTLVTAGRSEDLGLSPPLTAGGPGGWIATRLGGQPRGGAVGGVEEGVQQGDPSSAGG